ncbi:hypothetical protein I6G82_12650 [Lysinibacillus macroides]|uniref:Uncharacterized protein n=1 Tax=Lysinibacillus macroides TaxID=33935 RepID=A0A0N0CW78_9BACI|nr:hypothetical protein [Lysinibacillus macroides]KOY82801.1 hypothetical protein ADM90_05610 [Lysinibacillus macroides]QPR66151.1 hypothetical protein I6G82_12650 [Lysinibacillus macroides]
MKITSLSQLETKPVYTTAKHQQKERSAYGTETYSHSQAANPLSNYTPNEVGKQATVQSAPLYLNNLATPDWDIIPTKGKQAPPPDELIAQMKDIVLKNVLADKTTPIRQIEVLLAQYISPVSPDRKALYQKAMKAIKQFEAEKKENATPLGELSLVTHLNNMDFGTEKNIAMSANGIIKPVMNSLGGYDYEVVVGGQTLLTSTNGNWDYVMTPAEQQKRDEFYKIYWSFVDQARNE